MKMEVWLHGRVLNLSLLKANRASNLHREYAPQLLSPISFAYAIVPSPPSISRKCQSYGESPALCNVIDSIAPAH